MAVKANIRKIAFAGVVGALYATLTVALGFIGYGPVQFRIAEALCILPFFFPSSVWGLFVGCIVANLLSPYRALDIIAGSAASLISALCTMRLGLLNRDSIAIKALACFPPVFFNALIIGLVIAWSSTGSGSAFWPLFAISGLQVGGGQLVVLYALGLPLMLYLPKTRLFTTLSVYNS